MRRTCRFRALAALLLFVAAAGLLPPTLACYDRITSSGVTEPQGDIFLLLGHELVINCTLNSDYSGPSNSSDIGWQHEGKEVASELVTILDARSAQLHIRNLTESHCGNFVCRLKSSNKSLCLNTVFVGGPLPRPEEIKFSCTSKYWESLTCTWSLFPSCIHTNWTLSFKRPMGWSSCGKYLKNKNQESYGCVFDDTTKPPYDQAIPKYEFRLLAQNQFTKSISSFLMDHYSRVVPSPPTKIRFLQKGSTKVGVEWEMRRHFKDFPVPLVYHLEYQSQWEPSDKWNEVFIVNQMSYEIENLIPYTNYLVRLRCHPQTATDEAMWSTHIQGTHRTPATATTASIVTTPSNFIDVNVDMDRRDVTLFWQPVPAFRYFGPKFHYVITKYSDDENATVHRANATDFSFKFFLLQKTKSYHFKIQAANGNGTSQHEGTIFVPKFSTKPPIAEDLTLILYGGGLFKVSWKPPNAQTLVKNYLLVWCKGKALDPRLDPCYTPLNWTMAMANETTRNITIDDRESGNYRFGVAVNTRLASSGLTWSKCIAPHDGVLSKMKMPPLKVEGSTSIGVEWVLDCSERLGIVIGFWIQYCLSDTAIGKCKDGELKNVTVKGADESAFVIKDLKPYSYYRVTVAGITNGGVGEPCDPQIVRTDEGAPDGPPTRLHLLSVSNESFSIKWDLPSQPNGIIDHFVVVYKNNLDINRKKVKFVKDGYVANLTENVKCYSNYTVTVEACTGGGCSKPSEPLYVLTEIGVPGKPEAIKASQFNKTYILLEWNEPSTPNGPIDEWNLLTTKCAEDWCEYNSTEVVPSAPFAFPVQCDYKKGKVEFRFAVQAVTVTEGMEKLIGPLSEEFSFTACHPEPLWGLSVYAFAAAILAIGAGILLFLYGAFIAFRVTRKTFRALRTMDVVLPEGFMDESSGYSSFKKNLAHHHGGLTESPPTVKVLSRLQSVSSDEGRGSQNSNEITLHTTSSLNSIHDEILFSDKSSLDRFGHKHNLSSDSSGCSTGDGSVSSSLTTRIHLSSDSGTEADYPVPPSSPDSVFDLGWVPAANCQLRLRSNNNNSSNANNLQRLGEEVCDVGLADRTDPEPQDREDPDLLEAGHYCKAAVNDPAAAREKPVDGKAGTDPSSLTVYSRVALVSPPSSKQGPCPGAPQVPDSGSGRRAGPRRPSSYVAMPILSDSSGKCPTDPPVPYSCLGLVSGKDRVDKREPPKGSGYVVPEMTPVSGSAPERAGREFPERGSGSSVPCPPPSTQDSGPMPSGRRELKTAEPKCPSYVALTGLGDPAGEGLGPGYSKVGQPERTLKKAAPRCRPGEPGPVSTKGEVPGRGYVALGRIDPPQEAALEDNARKLSFDASVAVEALCGGDDGSSWESELEISEENLTDEDLHVHLAAPCPGRGYVCVGAASAAATDSAKDYVALAGQGR